MSTGLRPEHSFHSKTPLKYTRDCVESTIREAGNANLLEFSMYRASRQNTASPGQGKEPDVCRKCRTYALTTVSYQCSAHNNYSRWRKSALPYKQQNTEGIRVSSSLCMCTCGSCSFAVVSGKRLSLCPLLLSYIQSRKASDLCRLRWR